ncbi:MAG: glycosyltransferase family 4 protein [Methanosarcina sp.]|nr:glycosyltransferase family 4 protein [Methanosarcina sp.]
MRVLFVSSGNNGISPIVTSQAKSLRKAGLEVSLFGIEGKGIWGYLKNIPILVQLIRKSNPSIIHTHYSFCGFLASLSTRKPVVCSLMGSDVKCSGVWRLVIRFFVKKVWAATIVKSEDMKHSLGVEPVHVIPNGVDTDVFKPMDKNACRTKLGWDLSKRVVLFAANPARPEKNFTLAEKSVTALNCTDIELAVIHGIQHSDMPVYMNAADILLLTSLWEGSPNVVKEAMACDLPVVSTDVGDVSWLLGDCNGHFVVSAEVSELSEALTMGLTQEQKPLLRERLVRLGLDTKSIAERIIALYMLLQTGDSGQSCE